MRMDKKVIQRPRARCARGPRAVRGPRARCALRASIRPLRASIRCLRSLPPPGPRDVTGEACPLGRLEGEAAGEAARERRGQAHPRTREGEARGEATRTRRELLTCLALDGEGEGQEEEDRQAQKDDETEPVWCAQPSQFSAVLMSLCCTCLS